MRSQCPSRHNRCEQRRTDREKGNHLAEGPIGEVAVREPLSFVIRSRPSPVPPECPGAAGVRMEDLLARFPERITNPNHAEHLVRFHDEARGQIQGILKFFL